MSCFKLLFPTKCAVNWPSITFWNSQFPDAPPVCSPPLLGGPETFNNNSEMALSCFVMHRLYRRLYSVK